jgi:hypothetical protein
MATIKDVSKRRRRNRMMYHEVIAAAEEVGIELGGSVRSLPDIVMTIFRRTHALWKHAASVVDQLDPDADPGLPDSIWTIRFDENGNRIVELSKWVEYETRLREEVFDQAMRMSHLKIDERMVRVEETQLAILQVAITKALAATQGMNEELRRELGRNLRSELSLIEGEAELVSEIDAEGEAA